MRGIRKRFPFRSSSWLPWSWRPVAATTPIRRRHRQPRSTTTVATDGRGHSLASPIVEPLCLAGCPTRFAAGVVRWRHGDSTLTREQFQQQLVQPIPMEPAANKGRHDHPRRIDRYQHGQWCLVNDRLTVYITGQCLKHCSASARSMANRARPRRFLGATPRRRYLYLPPQPAGKMARRRRLHRRRRQIQFRRGARSQHRVSLCTQRQRSGRILRVVDPDTFEITRPRPIRQLPLQGPGGVGHRDAQAHLGVGRRSAAGRSTGAAPAGSRPESSAPARSSSRSGSRAST